MHIAANALYKGAYATGGIAGEADASGDAFSKIFGSTLRSMRSTGGIQEALNRLQERFPGMNFKEGDVAAGVEGAKKRYEEEDPAADSATVSSSVLAGMFGNNDLAKMVEDAISGFLERGSGNNLMNFSGAMVQRTVTITYTQVRYTEFHRSEETGELLGANELKTAFQEKLADLIKKFFGVDDPAAVEETEADETGTEEGEEAAAAAETGKTGNAASAGVGSWSLELYWSFTYVQTLQAQSGNLGGTGAQAGLQSWQYSSFASMTAYSSSLRGMLGSVPSYLSQNTGQSGEGGNYSLFDFLEDAMAKMGMSGSGLRTTGEGLFLRLQESRNLMAELMELYGNRINPKPAEVVSTESADEAAETADPAEIAQVPEEAAAAS